MDNDKVQAVVEWPLPKNLRELRGFLGLTGYYCKFVEKYARIAQPLTYLLRKDSFEWSAKATKAFKLLKLAIINLSVLAMLYFSKVFVVEADALDFGLGRFHHNKSREVLGTSCGELCEEFSKIRSTKWIFPEAVQAPAWDVRRPPGDAGARLGTEAAAWGRAERPPRRAERPPRRAERPPKARLVADFAEKAFLSGI
ncbi:hypothetical protein AgCh_031904 [Apium graveolens]